MSPFYWFLLQQDWSEEWLTPAFLPYLSRLLTAMRAEMASTTVEPRSPCLFSRWSRDDESSPSSALLTSILCGLSALRWSGDYRSLRSLCLQSHSSVISDCLGQYRLISLLVHSHLWLGCRRFRRSLADSHCVGFLHPSWFFLVYFFFGEDLANLHSASPRSRLASDDDWAESTPSTRTLLLCDWSLSLWVYPRKLCAHSGFLLLSSSLRFVDLNPLSHCHHYSNWRDCPCQVLQLLLGLRSKLSLSLVKSSPDVGCLCNHLSQGSLVLLQWSFVNWGRYFPETCQARRMSLGCARLADCYCCPSSRRAHWPWCLSSCLCLRMLSTFDCHNSSHWAYSSIQALYRWLDLELASSGSPANWAPLLISDSEHLALTESIISSGYPNW